MSLLFRELNKLKEFKSSVYKKRQFKSKTITFCSELEKSVNGILRLKLQVHKNKRKEKKQKRKF